MKRLLSNKSLHRLGSIVSRARVRARPIAWHGRALEALRPAGELNPGRKDT